jgi:hypothetical protein
MRTIRSLFMASLAATLLGGFVAAAPAALAQVALTVVTSPDPTPTESRAWIRSPAPLDGAPTVQIRRPDGTQWTVLARSWSTEWWVADLRDPRGVTTGVHAVTVSASASGQPATGASVYEVLADAAGTWSALGPNSQGGRFTAFAREPDRLIVNPQNARHYFETGDGGRSWRVRDRVPVGGGVVKAVVADPRVDRRLWAAFDSQNADTYQGKVFVSDDNGATWRDTAAPDQPYLALRVNGAGDIVVAVARNPYAVFVSRDGGRSWATTPLSSGWLSDFALVGDIAYFPTMEGVVRLDVRDPLARPTVIFAGSTQTWMRGVTGDDRVIVADTMFEGVWASTNAGVTWRQVRPFVLGTGMVKVSAGEIFVGYTDAVHISADQGTTWQVLPDPWSTTFAYDAIRWGGALHLAAAGAGVVRMTGTAAQRIGVSASVGFDLAVVGAPGAPALLAATLRDTYRTGLPAGSPEWGPSGAEGINGRSAIHLSAVGPVVYKVIRDVNNNSALYVSEDAGRGWKTLTSPSPAVVHALLAHPANRNLVVVSVTDPGAGHQVRISSDGGVTWRVTSRGQAGLAVAADPANAQRFYVGGPDGLWQTTNAGVSFQRVNLQPVDELAVSPVDGRRLIVARGGDLFASTDAGLTLRIASGLGLPLSVADLAFSPRDAAVVVAATRAWNAGRPKGGRGVIYSVDGGLSWRSMGPGPATLDIEAVAFDADARNVYALSRLGGVFRSPTPVP